MSKTKKLFIITLALILIVMGIFSKTYAEYVPVTKENLKAAFKELEQYNKDNKNNTEINVTDDTITLIKDGEKYEINYDLADKPTFTREVQIKQGMSYEEYKSEDVNGTNTLLGLFAVAKIQGVEFETTALYVMTYLASALEINTLDTSNSYKIIDDTTGENTIKKDESDNKTIYASEFGEHVLEYVNDAYKKKIVLNDKEGINCFETTIEKKDTTEIGCKIVTTFIVNPEADFSKMESLVKKNGESITDNLEKIITIETTEEDNQENTSNVENENVSNLSTMPKAGKTNNPILVSAYIIISLAFIGIIGLILTRKKQ